MATTAPIKVPIVAVDQWTKAFKALVGDAGKLGQKISSVGSVLTKGLTLPIAGLGILSGKFARDFSKGLANVGSLIPDNQKELVGFKKDLLSLSRDTAKPLDDLTAGLYESVSAFQLAGDPMEKLALSAKTAKAGVSTTKEALSFLSGVTKAYGDTSNEMAKKVADYGLLTVRLGQTTFPELASSMGKVTSMANQSKLPLEELFGVFATQTGISTAAETSTQFAAILRGFIRPTKGMSQAIKEMKLGYKSAFEMIQDLGLVKSLDLLKESTKGNAAQFGKLFESSEAINLVLSLTGAQSNDLKDKIHALGSETNVLEKAFKAQTEGIDKVGFKYDQMIAKIKASLVVIGDKLMPVFSRLVDALTPIIDSFSKLSDEQIIFRLKILAGIAVMGPLLGVLGKTITLVYNVGKAYKAVSSAMKAFNDVSKVTNAATNTLATSVNSASLEIGAAPKQVDKLSKSLKWLGRATAVLTVAYVGVEVGNWIRRNFVDPFISAKQALKDFEGEYSSISSKSSFTNRLESPSLRKADFETYNKNIRKLTTEKALLEGQARAIEQYVPNLPLVSSAKESTLKDYDTKINTLLDKINSDRKRIETIIAREKFDTEESGLIDKISLNVNPVMEKMLSNIQPESTVNIKFEGTQAPKKTLIESKNKMRPAKVNIDNGSVLEGAF